MEDDIKNSPLPFADPPAPVRPTQWSEVMRDAILEGQWGTAASTVCPVVQENGAARWKHDWKILQQARNTVSQYGVTSEATRQIVSWIFSADLMCPYDVHNLMRLLLTPAQFLLWDSSWAQRATQEAAKQRLGDLLYGVTAEMLLGKGPYGDLNVQLTFPTVMLQQSARLALDTFLSLPGSAVPSFGAVMQGATKKYSSFIDRLWEAVMHHLDLAEENKQQMFRILAFDNADKATKQILVSLPKGAGVDEMVARVERAEA